RLGAAEVEPQGGGGQAENDQGGQGGQRPDPDSTPGDGPGGRGVRQVRRCGVACVHGISFSEPAPTTRGPAWGALGGCVAKAVPTAQGSAARVYGGLQANFENSVAECCARERAGTCPTGKPRTHGCSLIPTRCPKARQSRRRLVQGTSVSRSPMPEGAAW